MFLNLLSYQTVSSWREEHLWSLPLLRFCSSWFQLAGVNHGLEAEDPPSDISTDGQLWPDPTSQCLHHSLHSISSGRHCFISHHHRKGEYSPIRYLERERYHIHITFILAYCYHCSILSLGKLLISHCA